MEGIVLGKLKDEYIKENGLYFLGSFINNRVNDGVHTNYQDWTIDYEMVEKHNFDELSFASLLHTITKVIPESKNMIEDLLSYYDGVLWYRDKENALKLLFDKWQEFKILQDNIKLFSNVKVDNGGYGISWNEEIDISCNELWENGKEKLDV